MEFSGVRCSSYERDEEAAIGMEDVITAVDERIIGRSPFIGLGGDVEVGRFWSKSASEVKSSVGGNDACEVLMGLLIPERKLEKDVDSKHYELTTNKRCYIVGCDQCRLRVGLS